MRKETVVSFLAFLALVGCGKKEKSPAPIPIPSAEIKINEPTKAETIEFLREELISNAVHLYSSKRANIEFDNSGRTLKMLYPVFMSAEEHINIVFKGVSISMNDGIKDIWVTANDSEKGVSVKIIKFQSNEKNAIFDDGYAFSPSKHQVFNDLREAEITLRNNAKATKIFNAFLHLQKLNKNEAQKTSDKF